ncbi:MAG: hypothetical protein P4L69_19540 [Desulfosporosinus sp.]|nr:hypothetical protein [Desulfosporosinus sp.]
MGAPLRICWGHSCISAGASSCLFVYWKELLRLVLAALRAHPVVILQISRDAGAAEGLVADSTHFAVEDDPLANSTEQIFDEVLRGVDQP